MIEEDINKTKEELEKVKEVVKDLAQLMIRVLEGDPKLLFPGLNDKRTDLFQECPSELEEKVAIWFDRLYKSEDL